jgi:hypothetical protein
MVKFTKTQNILLDKYVIDCLTFGIKDHEALEYIRVQAKMDISLRTLERRMKELSKEDSVNGWLNYFTRIGFVKLHREQLDNIDRIQKDSIQRYIQESKKEPRDEKIMLSLKQDIRDNAKLLSEFSLGTPIISAIKAKLQQKEKEQENEKQKQSDVPLPTSL